MKLSKERIKYLKEFIYSDFYIKSNESNYSDYWKEFSNEMKIDFKSNNEVIVYGGTKGASLYFNKIDLLKNLFYHHSLKKSIKILINYFKNKLISFREYSKIRHLKWEEGFDAVMNNKKIINHVLSKYYINHKELKNKYKNIFSSSKEVKQDYQKWGSMKITEKTFIHYYNYNILHPYLKNKYDNYQSTIMDIGGGNGLLASILSKKHKPKNMILVDLPQTIINSFCYLSSCFEECNIYLPTEFKSKKDFINILKEDEESKTKFILLTPEQISYIPENFVDLSINTTSFQEMNYEKIEDYFKLIEKVSKNRGLFYCVNRVQKLTYGKDCLTYSEKPIIFYEYPWDKKNNLLIDEVSRLYNACQYEPAAIRLQEIIK